MTLLLDLGRPTLPSPPLLVPQPALVPHPGPAKLTPCPGPACILPSRTRSLGGTGLSGHCIHTSHSGRGRAHSQCVCSLGHSPGWRERRVGPHLQRHRSQQTRKHSPSNSIRHLDPGWLSEGKTQAQPPTPESSLSSPPPRLRLHFLNTPKLGVLSDPILASPVI